MNYSLKRIWLTLGSLTIGQLVRTRASPTSLIILLEYEEQSNTEDLSQDGRVSK